MSQTRTTAPTTASPGTGVLGLLGLVPLLAAISMATVLTVSHIPGIAAVGCGPGGGCDKIKQSPLGVVPGTDAFFRKQQGPLWTEDGWPTAYLGLAYFIALTTVWAIGIGKGVHPAARWVARTGGLGSLIYLGAMLNEGALCPWCLGVHLANFAFIAVMEVQRARGSAPSTPADGAMVRGNLTLPATLGLSIVSFAIASVGLGAWHNGAARADQQRAIQDIGDLLGPGTNDDQAVVAPEPPTTSDTDTSPMPSDSSSTPPPTLITNMTWQDVGLPGAVHGPDRPGMRGFTGRYLMGPERARVRIVMVSNPHCPFCRTLKNELNQLVQERDDVSLSLLHFPLHRSCNPIGFANQYGLSCQASRDIEAAGLLAGPLAYWAVNGFLYASLERGPAVSEAFMERQITGLGIDWDEFQRVRNSDAVEALVAQDIETCIALGITQTPAIFLNGQPYLRWRTPGNTKLAIETAISRNPAIPASDSSRDAAPSRAANLFRLWAQSRRPHQGLLDPERPAFTGGLDLADPDLVRDIQIVAFLDYADERSRRLDTQLRAMIADADDIVYQPRLFPMADGCNPFARDDGDPSSCIAARIMAVTGQLGDTRQYADMHRALIEAPLPITDDTARGLFTRIGLEAGLAMQMMNERTTLQEIIRDASVNDGTGEGVLGAAPYVNGRLNLFWEYNNEFQLDDLLDQLRPVLANQSTRARFMPPTGRPPVGENPAAGYHRGVLHPSLTDWLSGKGYKPFAFQEQAWMAYAEGRSGLLHAPTGTGKTLAAYLGVVSEYATRENAAPPGRGTARGKGTERSDAEPLRVLWITPLRALAADTAGALREPVEALGLPWTVETRTGDTSSSLRSKQRERLPTVLVTTPESLTLLLTHADARERLRTVRAVIVDEWHELLSSKRGVQTELALARLRRFAHESGTRQPSVWGVSATIANIEQAGRSLVGVCGEEPTIISANIEKRIAVETLLPEDATRYPWSGHLGLTLLPRVIELIDRAASSLLFCNTRSQVELWYKALLAERPDWLGHISLHHGSVDREIRAKVEQGLREGRAKCVVCTSSLDLGVDFSPVELVMQVGSPKGVARLLQRAGRSGHSPGAVSRVVGVPAHSFELIEFAAAREAAERLEIEAREPFSRPIDVLAQHLVTVAAGEGFDADELYSEVRTAAAFAELTREQFGWALDFVTRGGPALDAYPEFRRVTPPGDADHADGPGTDQHTVSDRYRVSSRRVATSHRLGIGTITSDQSVQVRYGNGRPLGTIEESFVSKLAPGQRFVFAGNVLELVRLRDMTATVKRAKSTKGIVPRWGGGRSPLSTRLAAAVRRKVSAASAGVYDDAEMLAAKPVLEMQRAASVIPAETMLLIERTRTREGHHVFLFPFDGRQVHEGLGSLLAHRLARLSPRTVTATPNDYGLELLSSEPMPTEESGYRDLLSPAALLDDLVECVNAGQLARRAFRDVARIAGLIHPGYPGSTRKPARHLQASSDMFYDVFADFDPGSLLLDQARREVLEDQLEVTRLRACLDRLASCEMRIVTTERLTPFAFPLFAERLRTQMVSSESFRDRITKMAAELEAHAAPMGRRSTARHGVRDG